MPDNLQVTAVPGPHGLSTVSTDPSILGTGLTRRRFHAIDTVSCLQNPIENDTASKCLHGSDFIFFVEEKTRWRWP